MVGGHENKMDRFELNIQPRGFDSWTMCMRLYTSISENQGASWNRLRARYGIFNIEIFLIVHSKACHVRLSGLWSCHRIRNSLRNEASRSGGELP